MHARNLTLQRKYGITAEQFDAMIAEQGGVCAICDEPPTKGRLVVDHDHATGEVRGLLCARCNIALGLFRDAPRTIHRALEYLARAMV